MDHVAPGWDLFLDNSIYILSGPYSRLPRWFLDGISRVRGKGLFHLADELFTGGYEMYTNFDFVLRNYHSSIFNNPGIMTLPLGFTNDMMNRSHTPPMTERRFLWSFAGFKRAARIKMFENLKNVEPHKCYLYDSQSQTAVAGPSRIQGFVVRFAYSLPALWETLCSRVFASMNS